MQTNETARTWRPVGELIDDKAALEQRVTDLTEALAEMVSHLDELAGAWQRGALHENDGRGGLRSNRNAELLTKAQQLLKEQDAAAQPLLGSEQSRT